MDKKVSIILVNYNTTNDAIECIKSLSYIDYRNYEVIIVDNASRATEVDKLKKNIKNNDKCKLILSNTASSYKKYVDLNFNDIYFLIRRDRGI